PSSGTGNATITLSAQANTSASARTGTFTFSTSSGSPTASWTVTVTQPGAGAVDDCGSSTSSYCSWSNLATPISGQIEVPGDLDWFRITPTVSGFWVFTAVKPATNPLNDSVGTMFLSDGATVLGRDDDSAGDLQFQLSVALTAGQVYYLQVAGYSSSTGNYTVSATITPSLALSISSWSVAATSGGSTSTALTANTTWMVSSNPSWVSVSPSSGTGNATVTLTAQANTSGSPRNGFVTFSTTSGSPTASWTVAISQPGGVSDDCGSSTSSYCAWSNLATPISGQIEIAGDLDWFRITPTATGVWTFTASKPATNPLNDSVGTMFLSNGISQLSYDDDSAGSLQFKMSVALTAGQVYYLQVAGYASSTGSYTVSAAIAPSLAVGISSWSLPSASAGSTSTPLTANTTWRVTANPSWVSVSPTSGTGNATITITAQANNATSGRSGVVTLTSQSGSPAATWTVTVSQPSGPPGTGAGVLSSGVRLNHASAALKIGQKLTLAATVSPSNASNKTVRWTSSNTKVATVSATGVVTGKAPGKATITVTTANGAKTAKCVLTVRRAVTGVKLSKKTLAIKVGKKTTLKATVAPTNATTKTVRWTSSNPKLATVNAKGVITAKKPGKVTITVRTTDGGKTAKCAVTVQRA
ncbi:MAG: Ig-like domain-containing protein, partial [Actinomycetia bacterium]|nr:Ig-like domain-containing protein [Actinomycetes bacterium]